MMDSEGEGFRNNRSWLCAPGPLLSEKMATGIVKKFIEFVEFLEFYNARNYVKTRNCVNFKMEGGEKI